VRAEPLPRWIYGADVTDHGPRFRPDFSVKPVLHGELVTGAATSGSRWRLVRTDKD
jgi:hypothetical protein